MWVRGLKLYSHVARRSNGVAPHVGAWIETEKDLSGRAGRQKSHPMWVRGLKLEKPEGIEIENGGRTPCGCVD